MTRLRRPCLGARLPSGAWEPCGVLVDPPGSRCRRHAAMAEARRGTPAERGYDREYQVERARVLAPDPRTGEPPRCELRLPGCTTWATTADHVHERVDGERLPDALGGRLLRPACAHCNSARRGSISRSRGPSPSRAEGPDEEPWTPDP